ncbi:MAG: alpha/beta hydrolase domain-containing protein, partial [Alphaproteobacteria bacterium]
AKVGYEQAEWFLSGTARAFEPQGPLGSDGRWTIQTDAAINPGNSGATADFRTRILVYRPTDPARFDGTVVVEWLNVSGGLDAAPDWISLHTELIRSGHAWVGVSAQYVGVEGGSSVLGSGSTSLKKVDPVRYGSLVHPGDSFSYDIFSQAGASLLRRDGPDPLGGLRPERLIAAGESQSAFRMTTYVNAIDPVARLYDGFFIHSRGGSSAPLLQPPVGDVAMPASVRVRDDLRVPVLTFQTETDLLGLRFLPDRQPDGPLFRLWEVAGTAHADVYTLYVGFSDTGDSPEAAAVIVNAEPIPGIIRCQSPVNSGPAHFVLKAAFAALDRWVRDGEGPPSAPAISVSGSPAAIDRDRFGNAKGGIRTPHLDVPIATLSGEGQTGGAFCGLFGTTVPFDGATLRELYGSEAEYAARVRAAAARGVAEGWILPADERLFGEAADLVRFPG